MPYDPLLAARISNLLTVKAPHFTEKPMMGGRIFMLHGKLLCALLREKHTGEDLLMARVGEEAYATEIEKEFTQETNFTGRPVRGYIFVVGEGMTDDSALGYWLDLCIAFNPQAKASKKKKKN
ncbi:TfoX/Sxy family protein [Neolewinella aurantiaca]|uniref:TfoX/Sxy family protein n=1 Tax=Neolewinella aurantiaca TaxID=2602767 RepID=A0A5C7FNE0_9BACT|nr:TfoX/Sxy family protein [Neolewinella aurantiaca]TXF91735.1 TfoX/Sxy family protein [Neolewinella aurantiaca]